MDLFIDRANLVSLLAMPKETDLDLYLDCRRLMSRQLRIHYNFPNPIQSSNNDLELSDLEGAGWDEDSPTSTLFDQYFNSTTEGQGMTKEKDVFYSCLSDFDERCNQSKSKICVLDETIAHWIDTENILVGGVGEELSVMKKLLCGTDYDLHKLYDIRRDFESWEVLEKDGHALPTKKIVVFDRYLFANSWDAEKKQVGDSFDDDINFMNFFPLMKVLTSKCRGKVDIEVFTLAKDSQIEQLFKYQKILQRYLCGNSELDVSSTFVLIPNDEKKEVGTHISAPHDRIIITQYRMFRSGDSWHYFNKDHKLITKGKALDVDSLAKAESEEYANSVIVNLMGVRKQVGKLESEHGNAQRIYVLCGSKIKSESNLN